MRGVKLAALLFGSVLAVAAFAAAIKSDAQAAKVQTVSVQLLAFNDFHGNLEPPTGSSGVVGSTPAGGAEFFATHLAQLRGTNPNTLIVGAGDMIGATPLLSALFHDEPTIESLNMAGLMVTSVGNHEFDEGWAELWRMQHGGCHPKDGCKAGHQFKGAEFQFLSANVFIDERKADKQELKRLGFKNDKHPHPLLPAISIKEIGGVKVGFIGMTLENTPQIVTPTGIQGLSFYNEAYMANYWTQNLKKRGAQTVVVLLHEGGFQASPGGHNDCNGISGPIVALTHLMSNEIDVVVSGHTHQAYNCRIGTKLVTSAGSFGRLITDIDLEIDRATGKVVTKRAINRIVTRDVPRDARQTELVERYRRLAAPLANRVIGRITADITRAQNEAGESALGDVIADAQLAATKPANKGGAVVAFMNPGGIRADLVFNQSSGGEAPGEVTFGEAFTVQPFGNNLVTMTLTGEQIDRLLEQQWSEGNANSPRILQVSQGFTYTYDVRRPANDRVNLADIRINGQPITATAQYRVTVNSFLADGGDAFAILRSGTNRLGGDVDTQALEDYFRTNSPVAPGPRNRITRLP
ncbi:MAG TPA: bifunctional metallophosphatase/5'-nucleotidase [Gaiellaceae bacterium]|nr:bifunctional metallophosphatase/5'-nucleotidase [Gaiellaceae bacterium]